MKKYIVFFGNGNTFVSNKDGEQIPGLQQSWFRLYLEFLESKKINIEECYFSMPNNVTAIPFKTENGWNWDIK